MNIINKLHANPKNTDILNCKQQQFYSLDFQALYCKRLVLYFPFTRENAIYYVKLNVS